MILPFQRILINFLIVLLLRELKYSQMWLTSMAFMLLFVSIVPRVSKSIVPVEDSRFDQIEWVINTTTPIQYNLSSNICTPYQMTWTHRIH